MYVLMIITLLTFNNTPQHDVEIVNGIFDSFEHCKAEAKNIHDDYVTLKDYTRRMYICVEAGRKI